MVFSRLKQRLFGPRDRVPRRVKTPTVLQMEAAECGAAALGIILAYYRRIVSLVELRHRCGISRDGSRALNIMKAARIYGLQAKGFKHNLEAIRHLTVPFIVFWNFNHFVVVEGCGTNLVYLNDPATGPRTVSWEEFDLAFTGIVLVMQPGPTFERGGRKPSLMLALWRRLSGSLPALFYCILVGFLLVIPGIATPLLSQIYIDQILIENRLDWFRPLLLGMGMIVLIQGILHLLQWHYLRQLRIKLAVSMSSQFLLHLLQLPIGFYTQRFEGEISSRLRLNNKVAEALSGPLAQTLIDGVMVIFYGVVMITYDWQLTMIGITFAIANILVLQLVTRQRTDANMRLVQDAGKMIGVEIAALQSIETLKASASESDFFTRWSGYYAKYINAKQALGIPNQTISILPNLSTTLTTLLIIVFGGLRVISGDFSIGMLVAFQSLMLSFHAPIKRLVGFGGLLQELEGDLTRLDDVLRNDIDPLVSPLTIHRQTDSTLATPFSLQGHLEFRNVTFGYSPVDAPLIENLSFTLSPGQRIALVGGSGSGKSTVVNLASGLYQPWSGEILLDGEPLPTIPRLLLAQTLAMVEQDIFIFSGTVRDNLTLWNQTIPESQIVQACEDAVLHTVIRSIPGGYSGSLLEGATNLSGGQRQQFEIARALVKDPALLLLDEATSALDAATEHRIDQHLRRRGCSCLIVAHRLSTIRDCDEIIVLEQGQVVQRGTHKQLWQEDGQYAKLTRSEEEGTDNFAPHRSTVTKDSDLTQSNNQDSVLVNKTKSWDSLLVESGLRTNLQGNQLITLDNPDCLWWIESGSVAVFGLLKCSDAFTTRRRYLFSIKANNIFFGLPPIRPLQTGELVAVALEPIQLLKLNRDEFLSWVKRGQPESIQLLKGWLLSLANVGRTGKVANSLVNQLPGQAIDIQLDQVHIQFLETLKILEHTSAQSAGKQLQAEEIQNYQATQTAFNQLSSLFQVRSEDSPLAGDPLLMAVGAIGRDLKVDIQPISDAEDLQRLKDPLEGIVRASHLRMRRVVLSPYWWRFDGGPLLAYTRSNHQPVALLQNKGRYQIYDPVNQTYTAINPQTSQTLESEAFTFYRPLPEHAHQPWSLLQFALWNQSNTLLIVLLTGLAVTGLGMLTPLAIGLLIDQAIPNADRSLLIQMGFGLGAAALGSALFQFAQGFALLRLEASVDAASQTGLWDRLLRLKVPFFRQYSIGDLQARASAIRQIRSLLSGVTLRTLFTSIFTLINLILLFYFSHQLAWVAMMIASIVMVITIILGILSRRYLTPLLELQGNIYGLIVQLIGGISKLRVAGAEQRAFAFWADKYSQQLKLILKAQLIEDLLSTTNAVLPTVSSIVLFWIAVQLMNSDVGVISTPLSTGSFLAFNVAYTTFITGVTDFSDTLFKIIEATILWKRAQPILKAIPESDSHKFNPGELAGKIAIEQVSFRYRESGPWALENVSINASPGEFIALVGPSGSGKSTLLRLLLGFETSETGCILYDDQDLSSLDISAIRRQLGVVIQNGKISAASIYENIAAGALITMVEAEDAVRMAGFAEDVAAMPMGMHTIVSEGGTNLSGGQRQRLLIARALALKPRILLFDEATSALDNQTQEIVTQSLEALEVTRIIIAHRLSTIRKADRIYVLQSGQVVQQGNFETLSCEDGLFSKLISRQII